MDQLANYNFSKYIYSIQQTHETIVKPKRKIRLFCNECKKKRYRLDESHQICHLCYKGKSGNKVIDDFIKYTLTNYNTRLFVFVPYGRFKNVEFIAEGGFSKIYKAIWIDGPYSHWNYKKQCHEYSNKNYTVVLKKLNNSKNVTSKELNELKIFYEYSLKSKVSKNDMFVSEYFGITQDPITQDIMIIMSYYNRGDLINYFIINNFYHLDWRRKLRRLVELTRGLKDIHEVNIVHRDLHSGNIFFSFNFGKFDGRAGMEAVIGDLGISKSATDNDNDNENYGIIPYMAPEIFHRQKYTTASDIYSFGMIMWEFMTGRRPFWNKIHNAELIIEICDGLRPPIVTNAPEGYIDLMKQCWHPDPKKRPSASNLYDKFNKMWGNEYYDGTKIIKSPDIGPVTMNNPGAIYKSRPLSGMIQSAMSTRSLRSQSINLETGKRKFEDDQIENNFINGKHTKKMKLIEDENYGKYCKYCDYVTKELELDVDTNFKQYKNDYGK